MGSRNCNKFGWWMDGLAIDADGEVPNPDCAFERLDPQPWPYRCDVTSGGPGWYCTLKKGHPGLIHLAKHRDRIKAKWVEPR